MVTASDKLSRQVQIGWFCPGSKRFCYSDEKPHRADREDYTIPVFAQLETDNDAKAIREWEGK